MRGVFSLSSTGDWALISACGVLLFLLVISFRSRSTVFCQYLKTMTGISLAPRDVTRQFKKGGQEGVRELFLDLIIREDLKHGPVTIPDAAPAKKDESTLVM
jgi:hypothetical protein